jgi:hypothetical protein
MAPKPKTRAAKIAWLTRFLTQERIKQKRGFLDTWFGDQKWTEAGQKKACILRINKAEQELAQLKALPPATRKKPTKTGPTP